jgi:alpha-tubulin suppressor-like RCC1 family protein
MVGSNTNWSKVAFGYNYTVALKTDGTLWTWGNNSDGQLGIGDRVSRSSPVQIGAGTNWYDIAGDAADATTHTTFVTTRN